MVMDCWKRSAWMPMVNDVTGAGDSLVDGMDDALDEGMDGGLDSEGGAVTP